MSLPPPPDAGDHTNKSGSQQRQRAGLGQPRGRRRRTVGCRAARNPARCCWRLDRSKNVRSYPALVIRRLAPLVLRRKEILGPRIAGDPKQRWGGITSARVELDRFIVALPISQMVLVKTRIHIFGKTLRES